MGASRRTTRGSRRPALTADSAQAAGKGPCSSRCPTDQRRSGWPSNVSSTSSPSAKIGPQTSRATRSEEHTSELQSLRHLVCRLLLEKKKKKKKNTHTTHLTMS